MSLVADNLSVRVGDTQVCDNWFWQAGKGQCWAVLGRNGVGKTSLLHALAGLSDFTTGDIIWQDKNLKQIPVRERGQHFGVLLQEPEISFPVSALETVLIGCHPRISRWSQEDENDVKVAREALQKVGLEHLESRNLQTLSGGERRRVQFAQLLAQNPQVMFLDEPVNHLDVAHQLSLLETVRDAVRDEGCLAIMVLHDVNLAKRFCDHVLCMYGDGRIEAGVAAEMLNERNLSELYLHPMKREKEWFFPA